MENTQEPTHEDQPNALVRALAARIDGIERQIAAGRARSDGTANAPAAKSAVGREELSAELERHRDRLRDYEKALVERIADVDDDRRATASRLQRAWHNQREEMDDRLRRNAGLVAGLLILFGVLVAVALFLVYRQATGERTPLAAEVAEIRQRLDGVSAAGTASDRLRGELTRLSADVGAVVSSLERLNRDIDRAADSALGDERAAREEGEARVAEEMRRLEAEQKRLGDELKSLLAALEAPESGRAEGRDGAEAAVSVTDPRVLDPGMDMDAADADAQGAVESTPTAETGHSAAPQAPEGGDPAGVEQDAGALGSEETLIVGEDGYALQLIGFYDRDSLAEFAAREGLPARVYYLRQTHKGRPWYALVHSVHEGYAAAANDLSRLPQDLASLHPWIRPVPAGTELGVLETGPGR